MDILLSILIGVLQTALAALGIYVSLKPQPPERHRYFTGLFLLLAILAVGVAIVQQVRSTHTQRGLQGQLADIQKKIVKPPTAQENAAAVIALEDEHPFGKPQESQRPAIAQPVVKPHPSLPSSSPDEPSPGALHHPASPPEIAGNPPTAAQLRVTSGLSPDPSTREDAPVKTRVVVQTDHVFPTLRLALECNGPLIDGDADMTGSEGASSINMLRRGVVSGRPNIFVFTYGSAEPPFGPSNPINLTLWSKSPVVCSQATTF